MDRRTFLTGVAACAAGACAGCAAVNPAPSFDAQPDGSLDLPPALDAPGSQIKVRIPGNDDVILVWRADQGYAAASAICTHRGSEVGWNSAARTLDCPSHGSRFKPDGSVLEGPAKQPLRAYSVALAMGRLRLKPL